MSTPAFQTASRLRDRESGEGEPRVSHAGEVAVGERFAFGRNWNRFLGVLDEDRISRAERSMRRRHAGGDGDWTVEEGLILDAGYVASLGTFDVVYSWGVLHHTGAMWTALDRVAGLVAPGGLLAIAIYNDQGNWSARWRRIKRVYCSGIAGRAAVCATYIPVFILRGLVSDLASLRSPLARYKRPPIAPPAGPVRR